MSADSTRGKGRSGIPRYPVAVSDGLPDPPPPVAWGESRYLEVAGERMRVVERGSAGPRLLLVHGYASNAQAWRGVIDRLDGRFRMAAIDLVGFGWSSRLPTRPLTGEAYAERLAGVLDALGWERAHVAGASWGGGLAQRLAAARPERTDRLVLVATVDPSRSLRLGTAGLRLGIRFPRLARVAVRRAQRVAAAAAGATPDELARGYVDPLQLAGTPAFLDRFVAEHATSSHLDLARVLVPSLVIGPSEDRVVDPATTRSVAERIRAARYERIAGASHSVASEEPALVARLIADFLSGAGPGAAAG
jgi:pimeloyl-ACP methyl ester carboxylesterase